MRLFILIFLFLFSILHAQVLDPQKVKFGKISSEELKMTTYEKDQEAEAVVLFDKGNLRMDYDERTGGFQYLLDRHLRIKILKESATHYRNFVFPLEKDKLAKEEIEGLRGFTYNLINGKEQVTKLKKENIVKEKISDFYTLQKAVFSDVKEGSIIELKYTLKSNFLYRLPTWYFQREIPVDYTFFEAVIPEYFIYNVDLKGFARETLIENVISEYGHDHIFIKVATRRQYTNRPVNNLDTGTKETKKFEFKTATCRYAAVEVPSLKSEAHAPPLLNYFFRATFELSSTFFPFQKFEDYTRTWDGLVLKYRTTEVRAYEKPNSKIENLAQGWTARLQGIQDKIGAILENIEQTVAWNGLFIRYPQHVPLSVIKLGSANSAELNYLLLSLLRGAGIAAEPVLVSTRENGKLQFVGPSLTQFDHVIVRVVLEPGKHMFLDATSNDYPLGTLPEYDLNDKGRLIRGKTSEWVNIENTSSYDVAVNLKLEVGENGQLVGDVKVKKSGYASVDFRSENENLAGISSYLEEWMNADVTAVEINDFEDKKEDILINAAVDFSGQLTRDHNQYFLPSVLIKHYTESPFKEASRKLPVDFVVPENHVYVTTISLPEGKRFEKIPESADFELPDKKAIYSIRFIELNKGVQIVERLSIKKPFYTEVEYTALRAFFDLVIEHQGMSLIIR